MSKTNERKKMDKRNEIHQVDGATDDAIVAVTASAIDGAAAMLSVNVRGGSAYTYLGIDEAREVAGLLLAYSDAAEHGPGPAAAAAFVKSMEEVGNARD